MEELMVSVPVSLLKQLQWRWELSMPTCPCCDSGYKWGHTKECRLGRALKSVDPTTKIQE